MQTREHKIESETHKTQNENKKDNNLNGLKRNIKMPCFYNEDGTRSVYVKRHLKFDV